MAVLVLALVPAVAVDAPVVVRECTVASSPASLSPSATEAVSGVAPPLPLSLAPPGLDAPDGAADASSAFFSDVSAFRRMRRA